MVLHVLLQGYLYHGGVDNNLFKFFTHPHAYWTAQRPIVKLVSAKDGSSTNTKESTRQLVIILRIISSATKIIK
jgi:hypothetical protein